MGIGSMHQSAKNIVVSGGCRLSLASPITQRRNNCSSCWMPSTTLALAYLNLFAMYRSSFQARADFDSFSHPEAKGRRDQVAGLRTWYGRRRARGEKRLAPNLDYNV